MEEMITLPKVVYRAERKMRFFGITADEAYDKKFNIFIGVSISNKKMTSEIAYNYLQWAIRNTKEKVAIIIADELNIVNYRLLDGYSPGKAENRAKIVGDMFEKYFLDAAKELKVDNVVVYRWNDVKDPQFTAVLNELYKKNAEFKAAVLYFVRKFMRKKGKVITDATKVDQLATYILGELHTLLEGITVDGIHYGLCMYPTYFASGMSQFLMDIREGELEVSEKILSICKKKAALVESWLD